MKHNYMKDSRFASRFGKAVQKKARSRNPIGTDYNRAQQKINATLGRRFNKGAGYAAADNQVQAAGDMMSAAVRNRQNEQRFRKGTKAAKNERAKANSIGARLFGRGDNDG